MDVKQNFSLDLVILVKYWAFAVNVVSPNPTGGHLLRIKISFLSLVCTTEVSGTPKETKNLADLPLGNEIV